MNKVLNIGFIVAIILIQSCKNKETSSDTLLPQPIVSIVYPVLGSIQEKEQINGQVVYLNKATITAPITGYVTDVNIKLGDWIKKGSLLFNIQTKESKALQNSNILPSNQFGIIPVYASASGFINTLSITDAGIFITEGNVMATIVKNTDLAIQVNAPFGYRKLLNSAKSIEIELPDQEIKLATFYKAMPIVDAVSQTQQILFKLTKYSPLPENLNVIVKISIKHKNDIMILPKEAILTNETQDKFWIMKVIADSLALKIPVVKGLENDGEVEIIKPALKLTDIIIQKGAYGLSDSTKVKIK
ncbi:MAG: hypothetical protein PF484_09245 [Bacteroidales bacterium]|jgi:hypothetical protein|nr:hypothetical protein [Bacteroidales bacterium]